jgi:AAHS family benzoate transporter-like MFS transporter
MGGFALAPTPEVFGIFRFFVGLGTGALMPTAVAILVEFSAPHRRTRTAALGFAGVGVGGMLAGLLALWLVPAFGFRGMFVAGCAPLVLVLPLMMRYLPESPSFLLAHGRPGDAEAVATKYGVVLAEEGAQKPAETQGGLRALFADGRAVATVLFWLATFFCLLVLFGVASWLPALMTKAGYGLTSSLSFVLVLNGGAVVGALAASTLADRWGAKPVTVMSFSAAAVSLALLSVAPPTWAVYLLVAAAGFGTTGTQILLNAFVAIYYPARVRTTGLGMSLGVGRIGAILGPTYGGLLVAASLSLSWQFYAFAIPAALGGVAAALVPLRRAAMRPDVEDRPAVPVAH